MGIVSLKELYKVNPDADSLLNLYRLHFCLNYIRKLYDQPMVINRGFSTPEDQIEIYKAMGQSPKMDSCHLIGAAADIADPRGEFKKWILDHVEVAEALDIYFEDFDATGGMGRGWVHLQIFPPKSRKRFFQP